MSNKPSSGNTAPAKNKVKVSIVVPVCNVENYLVECLDSVVNQTLREIEIICVDDGSKDSSLSILREYEKKDHRVKVITKPNSGYGNTMNVGMDMATGEYIGIVESDDYVERNMFQRLYDTAKKFDAQIVKSDHYIFSTRNGRKNKTIQYLCPPEYYNKVINSELYKEIFDFSMMNWTGVYRTDFIRENNIRHNETPGASFQDNGFWFQVMSLAKRVVMLNEAFYYYRQDNPNSSINSKAKVYCICDEYNYIQSFIESNGNLKHTHFNKFFSKKVFNYLHSYKRIAEEFKVDFLKRIGEEFDRDMKLPYLKLEQLDPWILETAIRIADDAELYHFEDSTYLLRSEYDKIHSALDRLKRSKELEKGMSIRKSVKKD
ncbi:MAG: glycosyltransferase [Ruminiclostridium sp.]|nr:glycosyltransferase [Ruminiclostridium sp.]